MKEVMRMTIKVTYKKTFAEIKNRKPVYGK